MTKICYLHIGSPKTGTTTIQDWFARNRPALAQNGVFYPGTETARHNEIVSHYHQSPEKLRFNRARGLKQMASHKNVVAVELQRIKETPARVIVYSNELFLSGAKEIDLLRLRQDLLQVVDDIRVICYVRDPYKFLISRAQQHIKTGSFFYGDKPAVLKMQNLDAFLKVFGRDAVILRNFDSITKSGGDLIDDFISIIDLGLNQQDYHDVETLNAAISLEAAVLLSALNADTKPGTRRFLSPDHLANIGSTPFDLPPSSILAVRRGLKKQYHYLKKLGLDFTPPHWRKLPDAKPDWSPQTIAQVARLLNTLSARQPQKRPQKR